MFNPIQSEFVPRWKIKLEHLSKRYSTHRTEVMALSDVNLEVEPGQFYSFVGPSGCGKTTLLEIIGGLQAKSAGEVLIHRQPSSISQPVTSMVFQDQSVFPWMSVRENIAFGLKARGVAKAARYRIADNYIHKIGLTGFENMLPHQLSGGMKQRVAIARTFANDPEILLMDEPFAALDAQNRLVLQGELLKIWEASEKTVLFVTHSIDEAILLSDKIVVMTDRPGRIKEIIPVNFARPRELGSVRGNPLFGELFNYIWHLLKPAGE